jgi:hypothetical protein
MEIIIVRQSIIKIKVQTIYHRSQPNGGVLM